MFKGLQLKV